MVEKVKEVGWISKKIIDTLGISGISINASVFVGKSNIEHIKAKHHKDYEKYKDYISDIINDPDYGYLNEKNNSIELIKEFKVNNDFVRVALRISRNKVLYLRTLFVVNSEKMAGYVKNKKLVKFS